MAPATGSCAIIVAGAAGLSIRAMVSRMNFAWVTMPISRRSWFSSTCWVSRPAMNSGSAPASAAGATAAKYTRLPDPCAAISQATVKQLVPSAKDAGGRPVTASDPNSRGGCSWTGLDGYQYRWLDLAFQRFDPITGIGTAEQQASDRSQSEIEKATAAKGATTRAVTGIGDEAKLVSVKATKDDEDYRDVTLIARWSNVVLVVSYNGAGFEGSKTPSAKTVEDGAVKAAKEAIAAVG